MARKGENIYKRKDGRWEGRYIKSRSSTGKANYGYVYAKSYREVKAKLISQSSCTSNSVTVDPEISSDQFEQVAMEWFQAICPKVKESTSNKYRNLLSSYILPVFGSKQLRDITHEFIETQCNFFLVSGGLKENGLSSKTVSDILSLIRNVLQFATRNGKAISCDARSIQIKRQTKEMRVLSRAEQEKLCQYLYSNLDSCNIGILVCLFTGLRVGEICALRWEDVSFSDYTIHVHQTLQRIQDRTNSEYKTRIVVTTPKSACSIRTIPVPHGLMTILTAHKASSTGYILTNSDQNPLEPRTMQNHFKKVLKNSGITSANYHSLRHPYVKHTTKNFSLRLMDFQAQAYPDARRKTRGAYQLHRGGQSRSPVRPLCNRKQFSCLPPQSKMSWILYAISMRLSGYTSTRSISNSASAVVSVSASKIALDASMRLSCRACSSCFCFACANTAA